MSCDWSNSCYMRIYHGAYEPLPADTWFEVSHFALPTEYKGFWVSRTRGSGIWANTGRTSLFSNPDRGSVAHGDALSFFGEGCSSPISQTFPQRESDAFGPCAREKGYDSIQFRPTEESPLLQSWGEPNFLEIVLVNSDGHLNCGTDDASQTELRSGWMASRNCDCENHDIPETCGLIRYYPGTPMCEAQQGWRFWRPCDIKACLSTTCKLPTSK